MGILRISGRILGGMRNSGIKCGKNVVEMRTEMLVIVKVVKDVIGIKDNI